MILKNHGLLTTGSTVAEAFLKLYTLESSCKVQLMARACNEEMEYVPEEIASRHSNDLKDHKLSHHFLTSKLHFLCCLNLQILKH